MILSKIVQLTMLEQSRIFSYAKKFALLFPVYFLSWMFFNEITSLSHFEKKNV